MRDKTCANHPSDRALVACSSCGRGLCGECWQRNVDNNPWCEQCLHQLTSTGRRQAVTVAFILLCSTVAAAVWRWEQEHPHRLAKHFWFAYGCVALLGSAYLLFRRAPQLDGRVRARSHAEPSGQTQLRRVGHPYRAALKRSAMLVASPVSGIWTTTVLLLCMGGSAIAIPELLKLPRWLEVEWIIIAWWALWSLTLTLLLYRGWRLSDDHLLSPPRTPWSKERAPGSSSWGDGCSSGCDLAGCDGGGLGEAIVTLVVVVVLLAAAWFFVELLFPALFSYAYYLIRTSLARVANDRHGCEGNLGAATSWGAFWASLYVLPLALVVYAIHAILRSR